MTSRDLSAQEVASLLTSTKINLVEGGANPLKHFRGKLADIRGRQIERDGRSYTNLRFMFDQLEVLKSDAAHPWGNGEIMVPMPGDTSKGIATTTALGILLRNVPEYLGEVYMSDLIGKPMEILWTEGHKVRRMLEGKWTDTEIGAYEIVGISNRVITTSTPVQSNVPATAVTDPTRVLQAHMASLANGRNVSEFQKAALVDGKVKSEPGMLNAVIASPSAVLQGLVGLGLLEVSGDTYKIKG